ncbi:hypothetical protein [Burkholderia glumae]|uniref:hypothetical protein n=1 Tax=Burkholderia glumae TaxID=337 RepID=UPI00214FFCC2|nr:hypothetical protein [Burkholderia glumae]
MFKKTIAATIALACIGAAHATTTLSNDPGYSWETVYSFDPVPLKALPLHGITLGSTLPARCGALPSAKPCSLPVSKDSANLFVVTGLKPSATFGDYATSALVVADSAGKVVGIGQPVSARDADVRDLAVGLHSLLGDATSASADRVVFDQKDAVLSVNRTEGSATSVWLVEKDALPVVSKPFVAGAEPIANFKRWGTEVVAVK